jgi:hypothetical protein
MLEQPLLFLLLFLSYKALNRMPRRRDRNFWALRSHIPAEAVSAVELQELGPGVLSPAALVQGAVIRPATTSPEVSESRLRKIWLYT